ncbi:hypothetical protein ES702_02598 [subsurface metagenome]
MTLWKFMSARPFLQMLPCYGRASCQCSIEANTGKLAQHCLNEDRQTMGQQPIQNDLDQ